MKYLEARDEAGTLTRSSLRSTLPWVRSVIVCAINYNTGHPYSTQVDDPERGWIARYAWSGRTDPAIPGELQPTDYHDELLSRLRQIESQLHDRFTCQTRCYVDTGPLVERTAAAKAGPEAWEA